MKIKLSNIKDIRKILLSAMFLSLGVVLPFLTGQIKEIGDTLLPMHIPVMLCGLICGWKYGAAVGCILPFLRAVTVFIKNKCGGYIFACSYLWSADVWYGALQRRFCLE